MHLRRQLRSQGFSRDRTGFGGQFVEQFSLIALRFPGAIEKGIDGPYPLMFRAAGILGERAKYRSQRCNRAADRQGFEHSQKAMCAVRTIR